MKIELNVDSHQLSNEVKGLLESLTAEQKLVVAKDMLAEALKDTNSQFDQSYVRTEALRKLRAYYANSEYYKDKYASYEDERLIKDEKYKFEEYCKEVQSFRHKLVGEVLTEVITHAKEQVRDMVKADEVIQTVITETLTEIKKDFPKFVQNAMTMYLAQQMSSTMNGVANSLMSAENTSNHLRSLNEKLSNKGIY